MDAAAASMLRGAACGATGAEEAGAEFVVVCCRSCCIDCGASAVDSIGRGVGIGIETGAASGVVACADALSTARGAMMTSRALPNSGAGWRLDWNMVAFSTMPVSRAAAVAPAMVRPGRIRNEASQWGVAGLRARPWARGSLRGLRLGSSTSRKS